MSALLIATDLMSVSAASGAAQRAGTELRTVGPTAIEKTLTSAAEARQIGLIVIDLTAPIADVAALVVWLRSAAPAAQIIAFGPHVQEQRLAAAESAGCDRVISRGQWHKQAEQLLRDYAV
ncbi:response regulator [Botrimarina hoheduenensis]|uniref:Response regulatory domain-containing protein n=1 Tax=Botrimarina hoheduenensis TaxID=2528000 RepID=A0A5C5WCN3_9BACT|nr:response regulator [Botrimarina hoheduenensis]TWT47811.1 hypothetical protein Pla111_14340 [Botrimarina hoheduenensis]